MIDQNAAYSGGRGWSEWSLHRRPFQSVLGQASRAFSSMSIVAPNCCQRAVLHNGSICTPPSVMLILFSRVCLLLSAKALLLSKMNLASWLYPHFAVTCPEAIERLIIERDNVFRRQGLAILGRMSIAGQQHIVALSNCPADGGIDTILCLAPGDDQPFDATCLQLRLKTRLMKGIGCFFLYDRLTIARRNCRVNRPLGRTLLQLVSFGTIVLHINNWRPAGAGTIQQQIDVIQHLVVVIGFSHDTYLGIYDDQRCIRAHKSGSFSYLKHSFFCPQYTRKRGENPSAFLGFWLVNNVSPSGRSVLMDITRKTTMSKQEAPIQSLHNLYARLETLRHMKVSDILSPGQQTTFEQTIEEAYAALASFPVRHHQLYDLAP